MVERSYLASAAHEHHPDIHCSFDGLYDQVRSARNETAHEGASAPHLTSHAAELALVFEDALAGEFMTAQDFMARSPVCAALWEPLSFLRQTILLNSFSFLPIYESDTRSWRLVSDRSLARYLRIDDYKERKRRMALGLEQAAEANGVSLEEAPCCRAGDAIDDVARTINYRPVLVVSGDRDDVLLGIISAFDVL